MGAAPDDAETLLRTLSGPWAIQLCPAFEAHPPFPDTFYAGYRVSAMEAAQTSDREHVPTWSQRDAARAVADSLLPTKSCVWKVVVFLPQPPALKGLTTDAEAMRMMSHACRRAAESAERLAEQYFRAGDYSGQFFEADAEDLNAASNLLAVMGGVSPLGEPSDFAQAVEGMDVVDLRRRVLAQSSHIRAYASALDGFHAQVGVEGQRDHHELRRAYLQAISGIKLPLGLSLRQIVGVGLAMAPAYFELPPRSQEEVRDQAMRWFRALRNELGRPSRDPRVLEEAGKLEADQEEENPFGDPSDAEGAAEGVAVCAEHDRECRSVMRPERCDTCPVRDQQLN